MLNPLATLERFGDEEFLRELWLRARRQLPLELTAAEHLILSPNSSDSSSELARHLHKLRGLIANFLEGGEALAGLRRCEELCRQTHEVPSESWQAFRKALENDATQLENWLHERGFPCD